MKAIILLYVIISILRSKSVYSKAILSEFKVSAIHELLEKGGWNCTDVVDYFVKRAVTYNPIIKALINFNPKAQIEAYDLDKFYHEKRVFKGQLHCIPVIIKDNIDVAGVPSTGGIKALRYSIPNKDAPVIDKLRKEGAIVIAKANMAEMATGDMENSEMGGQCLNPFDLKRTCGSSSSGSCGGISSAMAIISLGTDTGGSILQPASFNGLFGMRTRVGYPKTEGIIPLFDKQDVVGPIAKHLDDLVLAYSIMVDNKTIQENYLKKVEPFTLKLGYFTNFFSTFNISSPTLNNKTYYLDPDIKEIMLNTIKKFKSLNVNVIEKSLNQTELTELIDTMYTITSSAVQIICLASCAKSSLNNYFNDSSRFSVDAPYKNYDQLASSSLLTETWVDRFSMGNLSDAACSANCQQYTQMIISFKNTIDNWFSSNDVDAYIFPSFAHPPFLLENDSNVADANRISSVISISPLTFYPSVTAPVGFSMPTKDQPDGLPVNAFLFSKPKNFDKVFQIFKLFENLGKLDKLPSTTPLLLSDSGNASIKQVYSIFALVFSAAISLIIKY
jgi:amidase